MRVISEQELIIIKKSFEGNVDRKKELRLLTTLVDSCKEPNPWMPLSEFLKSGFEGLCWVAVRSGSIYQAVKIGCKFIDDLSLGTHIYPINITHVKPIHRPEPPI